MKCAMIDSFPGSCSVDLGGDGRLPVRSNQLYAANLTKLYLRGNYENYREVEKEIGRCRLLLTLTKVEDESVSTG
jgi:hypothetical protein